MFFSCSKISNANERTYENWGKRGGFNGIEMRHQKIRDRGKRRKAKVDRNVL